MLAAPEGVAIGAGDADGLALLQAAADVVTDAALGVDADVELELALVGTIGERVIARRQVVEPQPHVLAGGKRERRVAVQAETNDTDIGSGRREVEDGRVAA